MFDILVVCTANICRSPASRVFLARYLKGKQVHVDSAGTHAIDGNVADAMIQELMIERGFPEIAPHRSRALMPHHLKDYQLILCMEPAHLDYVCNTSAVAVGRSMLLGHWAAGRPVADPIGQTRETYSRSLNEMQEFCRQWAAKIIDMGMLE